MLKKSIYLIAIILTLSFYSLTYQSNIVKYIDYKLYDLTSLILDQNYDNKYFSNCVIVDIDERSINTLGQWPWSRIILANLIEKINTAYPAAIGINILFPDKDRTSPDSFKQFYRDFFHLDTKIINIPKTLEDNDKIFANAIKKTDAVLSVYMHEKAFLYKNNQEIYYSKHDFSPIKTSLKARSVLYNYPILQKSTDNFGFVNASSDKDGIFRRMPLFIQYQDHLFPSFALAILLTLDNAKPISANSFSILGHIVKMDKKSNVLLNPKTLFVPKIPAVDILSDKADLKKLKGKIVLISSSASGLNRSFLTSNHNNISAANIHAKLIDNILNDTLLFQPQIYKDINTFIALVLSLLMLIFLYKQWYIRLLFLFFSTIMISTIWLFSIYLKGIYPSIGYLWTPFTIYFFTLTLFFALINHKDRRRFYRELDQAHSAALEGITFVAAMRDDETGTHLIRTKKYIRLLAEYLYQEKLYRKYLNPKYINLLYEAAPLHDIGKVGIPDNILKKRGKFTPQEYEIMKEHTILGKEMIERAMKSYNKNDFLQIACSIAYHHHERWDGKGYPQGLKGDEIPIEGQLMALADVYDALISKRIYKEAFSYEQAEAMIIENRAKAFNPVLVDAFIALREEFREISYQYRQENSIKKSEIPITLS